LNGILVIGAVALYAGQDHTVTSMEFNGRCRKAFAVLTSSANEDVTTRLPAVLVELKYEDYLKHEVFNLFEIENPINQAFAVFSSIKRAVGMSRHRNAHTVTIGPSTPLVRQFAGFTGNRANEIVRFAVTITAGSRGCLNSLDSVLGYRWDVLPAQITEGLDTGIKSLRFQEHRDFGLYTIRCSITATEGRFCDEEDHRLVILNNMNEAAKDSYICY
jgi:hypothetical protein